jgi:hypothetical protein
MTTRAGKDDKLERNPAKRNRKQKKRTQAANAHITPIPPIPVDRALVNYTGYSSAALEDVG